MKKREKIVIFFAVIAVLYGCYNFFTASTSSTVTDVSKTDLGASKKLVNDLVSKVLKNELNVRELYTIAQAGKDWTGNPFMKIKNEIKKVTKFDKTESSTPVDNLAYYGFVETGHGKLAIIGGREYEEGDTLASEKYCLKKIFKHKVVVAVKGQKDLILPLMTTKGN
ncbi:MAG: hypothetical protein J7K32_00950 [Deltaproteobacteria bacterium]|nr:hypothetical protein [Deltaproteobacteria bacterium]